MTVGQSDPTDFERLKAILTDPDVLAGQYLPQAEQDEHRRCTQSIVDAAIWFRPTGRGQSE